MTRPQAERLGLPEIFRTSVSHFVERDQAVAQSRAGNGYIADVRLVRDAHTRIALTPFEHEGHVDVWGFPTTLLASVVDVQRFTTHT